MYVVSVRLIKVCIFPTPFLLLFSLFLAKTYIFFYCLQFFSHRSQDNLGLGYPDHIAADPSTLFQYFHPHCQVRDLGDLSVSIPPVFYVFFPMLISECSVYSQIVLFSFSLAYNYQNFFRIQNPLILLYQILFKFGYIVRKLM